MYELFYNYLIFNNYSTQVLGHYKYSVHFQLQFFHESIEVSEKRKFDKLFARNACMGVKKCR
jgi:hypothetical protein